MISLELAERIADLCTAKAQQRITTACNLDASDISDIAGSSFMNFDPPDDSTPAHVFLDVYPGISTPRLDVSTWEDPEVITYHTPDKGWFTIHRATHQVEAHLMTLRNFSDAMIKRALLAVFNVGTE